MGMDSWVEKPFAVNQCGVTPTGARFSELTWKPAGKGLECYGKCDETGRPFALHVALLPPDWVSASTRDSALKVYAKACEIDGLSHWYYRSELMLHFVRDFCGALPRADFRENIPKPEVLLGTALHVKMCRGLGLAMDPAKWE